MLRWTSRYRLLASACLCAGLLCFVRAPAHACPCATVQGTSSEEVAQRAMVIVGDSALDYIIEIQVEGDATELGWLIPTPAVAAAPVQAPEGFLSGWEQDTRLPLRSCEVEIGSTSCSGDPPTDLSRGGVEVFDEGYLGDLEYAVLSASDGSDLVTWLQGHQFAVSGELQSKIDTYAARGWAFVALRVTDAAPQGESVSLGPILIHVPYSGTPVFPLGMTALSLRQRVSLALLVVADRPMAPANYPLAKIEWDQLQHDADYVDNYDQLRREAIGRDPGFVLERVVFGVLGGEVVDAGVEDGGAPRSLDALVAGRVLVRLVTDISPGELTQDLELEPDDELTPPEVPCVRAEGSEDSAGCAATGGLVVGTWLPLFAVAVVVWLIRRR